MWTTNEELKMWRSNGLWYCNLYFWRKWGGKTQQVVIDAYEAYKNWKIVISNIWLSFPHIRYLVWTDLVPILKEISDYCNIEKMPIEAPLQMLKEYWVDRKKGKIQEFFIVLDEAWKHLNTRNYHKNFKEEYLRDMLTEPRKYGITLVGVTQSWKRVDIEFREACEDWFLFSKTWKWIFERRRCTHLWVHDWNFNYEHPHILWTKQSWVFFDKALLQYQKMYYTGELNWEWSNKKVPHRFSEGIIFAPAFSLIQPVSGTSSHVVAKPAQAELAGAKHNDPVVSDKKRWRPRKNK